MKIAIPTNRMPTTPDMPATTAQISVVTSDWYSALKVDDSLSNTVCPLLAAQRRQAAPNRKPMPATIASVA